MRPVTQFLSLSCRSVSSWLAWDSTIETGLSPVRPVPAPAPATRDRGPTTRPIPAGYSSSRPIFVFLCPSCRHGLSSALAHRLLLDTASLDPFPPALKRHRDVNTSYVSGRRMLLDVALGCSCQTPLSWPGCRSSPACCWPPAIAAAAPPATAADLSPVPRPPHTVFSPPARHCQIPRHVNHSCDLSTPTRLPPRLQHRDTSRHPPERTDLRIAPNLPFTFHNTSTQMNWSRLVLPSEPSPQWIQIRHSWLRRR